MDISTLTLSCRLLHPELSEIHLSEKELSPEQKDQCMKKAQRDLLQQLNTGRIFSVHSLQIPMVLIKSTNSTFAMITPCPQVQG